MARREGISDVSNLAMWMTSDWGVCVIYGSQTGGGKREGGGKWEEGKRFVGGYPIGKSREW